MRCFLLLLFLSVPTLSFAQSEAEASTDVQAQRIFLLGEEAFANDRFAQAAAYFERALELSGRPELLFNVGAAYQRAGDVEAATRAFEQYLVLAPQSDQRDEVEVRLRVLRMEQGTTDTPEETSSAEDAQGSGVPAGPLALVIAGAGAIIGGGVALFVGGGKRANVEDPDAGTFWVDVESDANTARTLGIVGGVAMGVGAALAALGVVLWAQSGSDENDIAVRATLGGAMVEGQW